MATDRFGIDDSYHDGAGRKHETSRATRAALHAAMGVAPELAEPPSDQAAEPVRVLRPGSNPALRALPGGGDLVLEDGSSRALDGALPEGLPFGYHRLYPRGGGETLVVVSPDGCHLPDDLRVWGFAAQLYAARSRGSWGIGDLADLGRLGRWTRSLGGGVVMVNPLTAATPVPPVEPSPYYPSSRRFRNPLFLRIEELPGWDGLPEDQRARLTSAGTALNRDRHIDRDAIFRLKQEALESLYAGFQGDTGFDWFCAGEGQALTDFATYAALAERHGKDWRRWPEGVHRPDGADIARFRAEEASRIRFHAWTQWLLDAQLARASREIAVVHDLPIGLDVAGADAGCCVLYTNTSPRDS
jgi:4-alpha-glucanotransferase